MSCGVRTVLRIVTDIAVWASNREAARLTKKVHSAFQAHQVSAAKLYVLWIVDSSSLQMIAGRCKYCKFLSLVIAYFFCIPHAFPLGG
jgi:hypothetical protein